MQALEASGRPWTLNKGEGAFYGPKLEYVLARRHRPRLAMRHRAGRSQHARPARRVLYRRALEQGDAGDAAPRHVRLARTLHRHHDRTLCGASAAVAFATAGRDRYHHVGRRRLCAGGDRGGAARRAPRRGRPAQREDQLQGPRALAGENSRPAGRWQERSRRAHGLNSPPGQGRTASDGARRRVLPRWRRRRCRRTCSGSERPREEDVSAPTPRSRRQRR